MVSSPSPEFREFYVRPPLIERVELIPVKISDMQVNRARDAERARFVGRFRELCAEMETRVDVADSRVSIDVQAAKTAARTG